MKKSDYVLAGDRAKYYDFRKYMTHINGCKGGGDQFCPCGMSSVRFNLEQLLDEFELVGEIDGAIGGDYERKT
jgi:hypothetical protein